MWLYSWAHVNRWLAPLDGPQAAARMTNHSKKTKLALDGKGSERFAVAYLRYWKCAQIAKRKSPPGGNHLAGWSQMKGDPVEGRCRKPSTGLRHLAYGNER
jgi:hypothetical protein